VAVLVESDISNGAMSVAAHPGMMSSEFNVFGTTDVSHVS
jgi:hypothetical protein